MLGSTPWTQTGSATLGDPPKSVEVSLTFFAGPLDLEFSGNFVTFADDTESILAINFTVLGLPVIGVGNTFDILDVNGVQIGNWNWTFKPLFNFRVNAGGFTPFPDGGSGSFTQQILRGPRTLDLGDDGARPRESRLCRLARLAQERRAFRVMRF
jgi:hypothetical protein